MIDGKKENNFWYKKFKYYGKTFIQMSKNNCANISEYVIYYCHFHSTTIESNKLTKNGNIRKISKCNSIIFYYKYTLEYLIDWFHSDFCNKKNLLH